MFELKPLSREAIPAALAKAERYRLLNESAMAESICEDILAADPGNQQAIVMLILALSDQFRDPGVTAHTTRARALLPRLTDEYDPVLRWNACARTLERHPEVRPRTEQASAVVESEW